MKVYINGRFLSQNITGVQRFALEIVKAIDKYLETTLNKKENVDFVIIAPNDANISMKFTNIDVKKVGRFSGHIWEQLELPLYTQKGILLNLCNTGPILTKNQIVTIHDTAVYSFPNAFSFLFRFWYKMLFGFFKNRTKSILTVSNFSKSELITHCKYNPHSVKVITEGKEHILDIKKEEKILDKYGLKDEEFVLAVSSMNPNKNFKSILEAISILKDTKIKIVIAGGTNPKVFKNTISLHEDDNQKVNYIGYVTDSELKALYEAASCFIYPSLYEGFGLPPLEAMACGCPVIVSNAASLPEIFGDSALYCNPNKPEDISNKMKLFMEDKQLRKDFSEKGLRHSEKYKWSDGAKQIINVIEELL